MARLAAVEGLVVAAEIGVAEGVAIGAEGAECRIVAGGVVVLAIALRMVAEAVVGIARAIF